ncbi:MAG TPA: GGDEF domain-containing protein [Xanthobacteraceae bacterium]|nr:GGDEF domain-containing protein [Xanthobacteraceae bacterium]
MSKSLSARAKAGSAPVRSRDREDERQPVRRHPLPPARNVPSELAVLLGEIERLQSALKAEQARVKELEASVDTDPLTKIFNRRGFDRELKRSLAYVKRYWTRAALIYVDLDGFKPVNDQHGHAAGDAVLVAVAAVLVRNVRASDTVARLGGDEFGLILWNLSEADAAAKAWALEAAIGEASVQWEGGALTVGASIGFAMLGPSDELAEVLAKADHAMYARKAARKNYRAAATSR